MASIIDSSGTRIILAARHLFGRSRSMHTTVRSVDVSGQHAALVWTGTHWSLRDLGSRNGTSLDGKPLPPGRDHAITVGQTFHLGSSNISFTFADASEPGPVARQGEQFMEGEGGILALPSADNPQVLIVPHPVEGWMAMTDGAYQPIEDGQSVTADGTDWVISLPETIESTAERTASTSVADSGLRFRVSSDEEYVEMTVVTPKGEHRCKPRAHHYVLLTLARARLQDAADGIPESEQGWLYTADLEKMLRASANQIYISIHRGRKELDKLDVLGADRLVERRSTTRQVRMGISSLDVTTL